jgi:hypothetical protein
LGEDDERRALIREYRLHVEVGPNRRGVIVFDRERVKITTG